MAEITITGSEKNLKSIIQLNKRRVSTGMIEISEIRQSKIVVKEDKVVIENKEEKATRKTKKKK